MRLEALLCAISFCVLNDIPSGQKSSFARGLVVQECWLGDRAIADSRRRFWTLSANTIIMAVSGGTVTLSIAWEESYFCIFHYSLIAVASSVASSSASRQRRHVFGVPKDHVGYIYRPARISDEIMDKFADEKRKSRGCAAGGGSSALTRVY